METYRELLQRLANSNTSNDTDSIAMQNLLRRLGFGDVKVVLGVVYLEGEGTIESPPTDIHAVARCLIREAH